MVDERFKAVVQVVVAAIAAALYMALDTKVFGFNDPTFELVVTSIVAALGAHHWLWKPSGISATFGGGRKQDCLIFFNCGCRT